MAAYPARHNLHVYQGDTMSWSLQYKEGTEGAEVGKTLTGATITCGIKADPSDAANTTTMACTADADQTANPGLMSIVLSTTNSTLLTGSLYYYDVEVVWADSTVQTIVYGTIAVRSEVTV